MRTHNIAANIFGLAPNQSLSLVLRRKSLAAVYQKPVAIIGKAQTPSLGSYRSSCSGLVGLHKQSRADQATACGDTIRKLDESCIAVTSFALTNNPSSRTLV